MTRSPPRGAGPRALRPDSIAAGGTARIIGPLLLSGALLAGCANQTAGEWGAARPTTSPLAASQSVSDVLETLPEVDGRLSFDRDSDIYLVSPEGGAETRVFATSRTESQMRWAPDGSAAVFASNRDGLTDTELYVLDADGVRRLSSGPGNAEGASWSPDSRAIVYGRPVGESWSINAIDVAGSEDRELFHDSAAWVGSPDWSPDGETIIFGLDRGGGGQIDVYAIDADGHGLSRLTDAPGDDSGARWSPDGATIAFWSDRDGGGIYLMDPNGGNQRRIHADGLHLDTAAVAWSPDGGQLAWTGKFEGGGGSAIYVMKADGSDLRQVTQRLVFRSFLDWQPVSASE